jgi:choline dehydrogenase-like flavoprotein
MANLNNKAASQNTFDAIVVGTGITGGWAAKELTEKGLTVLLLERGGNVEHPNYETAIKNPWEFDHRGRLTQQDRENHFIQTRHYSINEYCKHYYINDKQNPYGEVKRYDWVRANVVGGRSLLWARACYRWGNIDFEANAKDGYGVDWPIRYKDLEPWYDYVEKFIGVSGQSETGFAHFPNMVLQPAMEMNCVEKDFKSRAAKNFPDRLVTIGRTANLTAPVKGRGVCQARNQCDRGCPYGAYFSTNASTLPAAFATGNLTLRPNSVVNRVLYDEKKNRATGVEIVDAETKEVIEFYASIIFLNAATLATTFILLNSISSRFPNGLGNDSDQVGRNVMDHHKGAGASASVEGFEDQYYSGRRPTGIYVPRYRNLNEKRHYLRGFGLQGGAGRSGWWSALGMETIGESLKTFVQTPGGWNISLGGFGECLPYANNRVTLNTDKKDVYDRNTLRVDVEFKDNEKLMHEDIADSAAEMLEACGYKNVKRNSGISFPGNANHEMGTARMGHDSRTSVLNSYNQMHEVKNVFITDGSCMTSSGNMNPSLTYMALTARACNYAVSELRSRNI